MEQTDSTDNASNTKFESLTESEIRMRKFEARRRKILENAKSRMEKLGVRSNNIRTRDENGVFEYSDPEVEPNEVKFPFNKFLDNSANDSTSEHYDPFAEEKPVKDLFIFKYRLHVLVSIISTYSLALFGFMSDLKYSVVIPTFICMALEVVLRQPKPVNPIIALAVTLSKLPSAGANVIWRLSSILYDLVVDLGLTIFCIVTLTLAHNYLKGSKLYTLQ